MDGQLKTGTFLTAESSNKYKVISLLGAAGKAKSTTWSAVESTMRSSGISNTWRQNRKKKSWTI